MSRTENGMANLELLTLARTADAFAVFFVQVSRILVSTFKNDVQTKCCMRNLLYLFLVVFASCERQVEGEKAGFDSFVFSSTALHSDYSVKFTGSDTIYLERRFPNPTERFYGVITKSQKDSVHQVISEINFAKYDSIYDEYKINGLVDGGGYKFYLENGPEKKWIYVYGDIAPEEIYRLASFFESLKEKQKFCPTTKKVDFGDLNHILLPEPPPLDVEDYLR